MFFSSQTLFILLQEFLTIPLQRVFLFWMFLLCAMQYACISGSNNLNHQSIDLLSLQEVKNFIKMFDWLKININKPMHVA